MRVIWTEGAAQDLTEIVNYIADDDPKAARRVANLRCHREMVDDKAFLKRATTARLLVCIARGAGSGEIRWPLAVAG
jgi:hypothetical protein